jgi:hypothetical protein
VVLAKVRDPPKQNAERQRVDQERRPGRTSNEGGRRNERGQIAVPGRVRPVLLVVILVVVSLQLMARQQ